MKFFHIFQMKTLNLKIEKFIVFFRVMQKFALKNLKTAKKQKILFHNKFFHLYNSPKLSS